MSHMPPAAASRAPGFVPAPTAVQRLEGVAVAAGRAGPVVQFRGRRFVLEGAPALPPSAKVTLEIAALPPGARPARLVALDGAPLASPLLVRLRPALPPAGPSLPPATIPAPGTGPHAPAARLPTAVSDVAPRDAPAAQKVSPPEPAVALRLLQAIQAVLAGPSREGRPSERSPDRALSDAGEPGLEPFRQAQAGNWRLLLLPFGAAGEHGLRLYLGEAPSDGSSEAEEAGAESPQRALFELELSRLGRCQLDVLCQARRFDLVVRSERRLDASLEAEVRTMHQAVLEAAAWSGSLGFRPELLVMPPAEPSLGRPVAV